MYKNNEKLYLKSDFKDFFFFFWNLQQMGSFETYNKWAKWQGFSVDIRIFPQRVVCPCPGAIYMWKNIKTMCIKSEFKEICLKLATNGRSDKCFLLTSNVCPQGFAALIPGLYTCMKSLKMYIKLDSKRSVWNLQHMGTEQRPFCCHQTFDLNGLSAPALGFIHTVKH